MTGRSLRLGGGPGGEFDRLRAIFATLGAAGRDLGDDCALLPVGGRTLAISIDLSLEGVHFRTDWLSFPEIGWRATAAALSDLAAEGAEPVGVLVSVGLPGKGRGPVKGRRDPATEIMRGVGAAARSVGASVLGGDLVRSPRYLVDVCVLGFAQRPMRRSGARPGDGLWVTGRLGGAGLALAALRAGRRLAPAVRRRFAHPHARPHGAARSTSCWSRCREVSGTRVQVRFAALPGSRSLKSGAAFRVRDYGRRTTDDS